VTNEDDSKTTAETCSKYSNVILYRCRPDYQKRESFQTRIVYSCWHSMIYFCASVVRICVKYTTVQILNVAFKGIYFFFCLVDTRYIIDRYNIIINKYKFWRLLYYRRHFTVFNTLITMIIITSSKWPAGTQSTSISYIII